MSRFSWTDRIPFMPAMKKKAFFYFWRHVVPHDFYSPIPDLKNLSPKNWNTLSDLPGIDMNEQAQVELLARFTKEYAAEFSALPASSSIGMRRFFTQNDSFGSVDALLLYGMIRAHRPRRIIEIGAGCSTLMSAQALLTNARESSEDPATLISIEPYPRWSLLEGVPGLSRVVTQPVQEVPLETFAELGENDILFIDSSHVCKIGSDVLYELGEILPRLAPGVLVHFHDIFLPAEYHRYWVLDEHRFWNEQYMLQAFLAFNSAFTVLWGGSFMHLKHQDMLQAAIQIYNPQHDWPGSFWIKKIA